MKSLGICIGASTLSAVDILKDNENKISTGNIYISPHEGNPREAFLRLFQELDIKSYSRIAVTGRRFRQLVNLSSIPEPEAVETALLHLFGNNKHFNAVVSAGGETFVVYVLGKDGRIISAQTGNKCASGTGEFFLQQIKRMGISLDEALSIPEMDSPYKLSSRCTVFCKSDCTHATNTGVPKGPIIAGLCQMMAWKILEIMRQVPRTDIMIIGGTSQNSIMIDYLNKEITDLVVPKEAPYFEALGAALWALDNKTDPAPSIEKLIKKDKDPFFYLPPLKDFEGMVDFKTAGKGETKRGDRCILGLDVGSTTTKAILLRISDNAMLASIYLRTNGDPVKASKQCYQALYDQLGDLEDKTDIVGLGVTGSGRQIAGLHAMTDSIINEIIAHATGALFYDKNVDTIFEIGGQDSKYTYITSGVASDYAMNEACSAGTGSFLEEAAKETLGIEMEEIGDIAMQGQRPPNFNDQCAAFIGSDIKIAFHEGIGKQDIVAGLVYSIGMNYNNRVKGNRPVGRKVFMQGGVCYNRAVPIAMASLLEKEIIVPPNPGLIGAFGVALEVKHRIGLHLMKEKSFSLKQLKDRSVEYGKSFICKGCDRKCEIARIKIEGKTYPFGGACNKWYNLRFQRNINMEELDLVDSFEKLIFHKYIDPPEKFGIGKAAKTMGINKSFFVNEYYPLYYNFFALLGFKVVLPDTVKPEGINRKGASFCYPGEISHGYFLNLLEKRPDYLFMPQLKSTYVETSSEHTETCPISQGEPYWLATAYKDNKTYQHIKEKGRVLSPVIDFDKKDKEVEKAFLIMAPKLGISKKKARMAYMEATHIQKMVFGEMKEKGREALQALDSDPDKSAVVIFGRSYNAFVPEAHMGIPGKFASRNIMVIPHEFLTYNDEPIQDHMYWSAGQTILRAASFVKKHPQLFGCYITNFSCGPDSFLVGYFRDIMGKKPSLTLELDSHTADAGLETRVEAFLDIVKSYRELERNKKIIDVQSNFVPAEIKLDQEKQVFIDSSQKEYSIFDPDVRFVVPSMGYLSDAGAAIFRSIGLNVLALPPADEEALRLGRGNTSGKECLPLTLTTGSLLQYLKHNKNNGERVVYAMPTASGPCRFGQYHIFVRNLIKKLEIRNVAVFSSLTSENSYSTPGARKLASLISNGWSAVIISDIMQDVYSTLLANAVNPDSAMKIYKRQYNKIIGSMEDTPDLKKLTRTMKEVAGTLRRIPVTRSVEDTPTVLLTGEIFARHDEISRQSIIEKLADNGFASKVSSVIEWVYYTDWLVKHGLSDSHYGLKERLLLFIRSIYMKKYEKTYRKAMAKSGLFQYRLEDVDYILNHSGHLINPQLTGEAVLTIGTSINEALDHYCGVIAIGPFGCMPSRLAESILTREMNKEGKTAAGIRNNKTRNILNNIENIPFLAIESDGNPFPQIITAQLDTFLLQAKRTYEEMNKN
jgi:predicted CoA-substrate-specific enzyme activase